MFGETWAEPVIRQVVKLEEHYESDEVVLALAGNKANLYQKYGIDTVTDHLLGLEVTVRVDVGMGSGSPDPMEAISKLQMATKTLGEIMQPFMENGMMQDDVSPKTTELGDYVFAAVGIRDGAERFFNITPKGPPQPAAARSEDAGGAGQGAGRAAEDADDGGRQGRRHQVEAGD